MSERLYDCPQCGAPVAFRSSIAVFAVCSHCQSMVVAKGAAVETMGIMAQLPPDLTPFQIGANGQWKGDGFSIVGRVRVSWAEGSWNEWHLLFSDGRAGWLGEAQGQLMISFAVDLLGTPSIDASAVKAGTAIEIGGQSWIVADVKETACVAGEGELPFVATPEQTRVSADLTNASGGFGSLEFYEDGPQVYAGSFVKFDELQLDHLRPVPGWDGDVAQEKYQTTALGCPNCGAPVQLRAAGLSMSATCGSCASLIDTANPQLTLIEAAHQAQRQLPSLIPIGQRGKLAGVEWEVIGLCRRGDQYAEWSEYLLFNPWQGFMWLVSYNGHWSAVERLTGVPNLSGSTIFHGGQEYRLFATGLATVKGVLGEFYWKVRIGEDAALTDFIAPPGILSKEVYSTLNEFTWSRGTYLPHAEVAAAFQLPTLAEPSGIYLNQPNPFADRWRRVRFPWAIALGIFLLLQIFFVAQPADEVPSAKFDFVYQRPIPSPSTMPRGGTDIALEATEPVLVSPHFVVRRAGRVDLEGVAQVSNNWMSLDIDLMNVATGQGLPAQVEVSYYHGADSDGSWSEGGRDDRASIPAVPAGEYYLTIEPSADEAIKQMPFTVRVYQGGIFWANFILAAGLISLYPLYVLARRHMFERARWGESDFNPYASNDE